MCRRRRLRWPARVFGRINAAEEEVHGTHVHFHEVGADDAIADIIGACTALHTLGVDGVKVLPVTVGNGTGTGSLGPSRSRHRQLRQSSGLRAGHCLQPPYRRALHTDRGCPPCGICHAGR